MLWITKGTTTLTLGASASQAPTSLALILLRWTVKKKNRSLLIILKVDSNLIIWLDNPRNCWRLMLWNKMFYYSHQDKEKTEEWSKVCKCDYNMCKWTVSAAILVGIKEVTLTATYHPGISPITKHIWQSIFTLFWTKFLCLLCLFICYSRSQEVCFRLMRLPIDHSSHRQYFPKQKTTFHFTSNFFSDWSKL